MVAARCPAAHRARCGRCPAAGASGDGRFGSDTSTASRSARIAVSVSLSSRPRAASDASCSRSSGVGAPVTPTAGTVLLRPELLELGCDRAPPAVQLEESVDRRGVLLAATPQRRTDRLWLRSDQPDVEHARVKTAAAAAAYRSPARRTASTAARAAPCVPANRATNIATSRACAQRRCSRAYTRRRIRRSRSRRERESPAARSVMLKFGPLIACAVRTFDAEPIVPATRACGSPHTADGTDLQPAHRRRTSGRTWEHRSARFRRHPQRRRRRSPRAL